MTQGLVRLQDHGDFHFVTFSCFGRRPYLHTAEAKYLFEDALERARIKYGFVVAGYVVMPEHVHLLINEPSVGLVGDAIKSIKLSVALRRVERPFWLAKYYDFNVFTRHKTITKLRYLHRNPVTRGLVAEAGDWVWSSFRHYATGERGIVKIESEWTAARRERKRLGSEVLSFGMSQVE